jgi:hypothetical protein
MNSSRLISKWFVVLLSLALSGCAAIPYESTSEKPVTANAQSAGYQFVQHIAETHYQFHFLWGLIPFRVEGQEGVFKKYINNGDAIVNVRSSQEWDIISWLASSFTYGIVHLTHTEFEGDLVKKA